jgi:predicted nucleic acid-binding protein
LRAVLDTNVLVSALFWAGTPRQVVDLAAAHVFQALTSRDMLAEFEAVLVEDFSLPAARVEAAVRDTLSYA